MLALCYVQHRQLTGAQTDVANRTVTSKPISLRWYLLMLLMREWGYLHSDWDLLLKTWNTELPPLHFVVFISSLTDSQLSKSYSYASDFYVCLQKGEHYFMFWQILMVMYALFFVQRRYILYILMLEFHTVILLSRGQVRIRLDHWVRPTISIRLVCKRYKPLRHIT